LVCSFSKFHSFGVGIEMPISQEKKDFPSMQLSLSSFKFYKFPVACKRK
jgi:hypothetical protein